MSELSVSRARDRLNAEARHQLRGAEITPVEWARRWFGGDQWLGDRCGCPDDRCMDGYHHDPRETCECLQALLATARVQPR